MNRYFAEHWITTMLFIDVIILMLHISRTGEIGFPWYFGVTLLMAVWHLNEADKNDKDDLDYYD